MKKWAFILYGITLPFLGVAALAPAKPRFVYVKKSSRHATLLASLKASGLPSLDGKWYYIGPFDNTDKKGFPTAYPPEKEINLKKTYAGKGEVKIGWK